MAFIVDILLLEPPPTPEYFESLLPKPFMLPKVLAFRVKAG